MRERRAPRPAHPAMRGGRSRARDAGSGLSGDSTRMRAIELLRQVAAVAARTARATRREQDALGLGHAVAAQQVRAARAGAATSRHGPSSRSAVELRRASRRGS